MSKIFWEEEVLNKLAEQLPLLSQTPDKTEDWNKFLNRAFNLSQRLLHNEVCKTIIEKLPMTSDFANIYENFISTRSRSKYDLGLLEDMSTKFPKEDESYNKVWFAYTKFFVETHKKIHSKSTSDYYRYPPHALNINNIPIENNIELWAYIAENIAITNSQEKVINQLPKDLEYISVWKNLALNIFDIYNKDYIFDTIFQEDTFKDLRVTIVNGFLNGESTDPIDSFKKTGIQKKYLSKIPRDLQFLDVWKEIGKIIVSKKNEFYKDLFYHDRINYERDLYIFFLKLIPTEAHFSTVWDEIKKNRFNLPIWDKEKENSLEKETFVVSIWKTIIDNAFKKGSSLSSSVEELQNYLPENFDEILIYFAEKIEKKDDNNSINGRITYGIYYEKMFSQIITQIINNKRPLSTELATQLLLEHPSIVNLIDFSKFDYNCLPWDNPEQLNSIYSYIKNRDILYHEDINNMYKEGFFKFIPSEHKKELTRWLRDLVTVKHSDSLIDSYNLSIALRTLSNRTDLSDDEIIYILKNESERAGSSWLSSLNKNILLKLAEDSNSDFTPMFYFIKSEKLFKEEPLSEEEKNFLLKNIKNKTQRLYLLLFENELKKDSNDFYKQEYNSRNLPGNLSFKNPTSSIETLTYGIIQENSDRNPNEPYQINNDAIKRLIVSTLDRGKSIKPALASALLYTDSDTLKQQILAKAREIVGQYITSIEAIGFQNARDLLNLNTSSPENPKNLKSPEKHEIFAVQDK